MLTTLRGLQALQQLRIDLQESAGIEFPQSHLRELLILYDTCKSLELSTFQAQEVLGAHGYDLVTKYINQPVCVKTSTVERLLSI